MPRRDRTTGKPKHRPKPESERGQTVAGVSWREGYTRWAILGGVGALLLVVVGLIGYRWYDENIGKPREVVLRVEDQSFSLGYFTDRLGPFAVQNPNLTEGFREPAMLTRLEEEAIMVHMARERGYDLSDEAVLDHIAEDLGLERGGDDNTFDEVYRSRVRQTGMGESDYRRMSRASLAESLLLEDVMDDVGETGETVTLRAVLHVDEDEATAIYERIDDGEDMGEVALEASLDPESREDEGLLEPSPRRLYPGEIREALEDADEGDLIEPLEAQGAWWVIRVEDIDPDGEFTEEVQQELADEELRELIEDTSDELEISRSLSDSQRRWAYRNWDVPDTAQVPPQEAPGQAGGS